jgi:hypothetical protein
LLRGGGTRQLCCCYQETRESPSLPHPGPSPWLSSVLENPRHDYFISGRLLLSNNAHYVWFPVDTGGQVWR